MSPTTLFEHILLIEDDESHALIISRALKGFCDEIKHCASIAEAFDYLKERSPELILTDLHLPDTQRLQHVADLGREFPQIPRIVLTSSTSITDAIEAMKMGAVDFIVKNFDEGFRDVIGLSLTRAFSINAFEREKAKLQRQMDVLRMAIENSADGLAVVNTAGAISYSNHGFQSFVRLCGGNGQDIHSLFTDVVKGGEGLQRQLSDNLASLTSGSVWHTDITFSNTKNMAFDLSLAIMTEDNLTRSEVPERAVVWVRNISEQKRREHFQRELLSTTTHDLKGPLGAILISCELLGSMGTDSVRGRDLVVRVESLARGSLNLIEEFLSARRIQEGTFILKPTPNSVQAVVDSSVDDYAPIAQARSIKLTVHNNREDTVAEFDKLAVQRLISNLLGNALKFTPKGGKVDVTWAVYDQDFEIAVQDTGCGMDPAKVAGIFEIFSRLEEHGQVEGTGIGLYVVKSIVEAHGGQIQVTSKPEEGTRFAIRLPKKPPVNERGELISLSLA